MKYGQIGADLQKKWMSGQGLGRGGRAGIRRKRLKQQAAALFDCSGRETDDTLQPQKYKRGNSTTPAANMRYTYNTHAVHMQYTCSTHTIHIQYSCSTHTVLMQYTCNTHAVLMQYMCSTHAVHMQYTSQYMQYTFSTTATAAHVQPCLSAVYMTSKG